MRIDYDRMAEVFDSTRSSSPELTGAVARGVCAIVHSGDRMLDIGSGTGRFMLPLAEAGIEIYGLDVSSMMLEKARLKGLGDLVRGDATALPFIDHAFKASLVTNVLHLVKGWRELLSEACRVSARAIISFDIDRDEKDPISAFKEIMKEEGFAQPRAGPLESELAKEYPPERLVDLGSYEERKGKGEVLSALKTKTYTFQSDLTDGQNRICMDEYIRRFPEEVIIWTNSVSMIVWNPDRLHDNLRKTTFGYPHARTF